MITEKNGRMPQLNNDSPILAADAFSRQDQGDDLLFYQKDRFVSHLDKTALKTVEHIVGSLITEEDPVVLDLMASWDSHIPATIKPRKVVGLGLNQNELNANPAITDSVIHDINKEPVLAFPDGMFDAVLCTVSVDYMTRPIETFKEVRRVLKPGGLFLVIFSNRMFPEKAVKVWKDSGDSERLIIVSEFFQAAGGFEPAKEFVSMGRPRPLEDKYAATGLASDPVYAVFAEKRGGAPNRAPREIPPLQYGEKPSDEEMEKRVGCIKETLQCPHCGEGLKKWMVPENPFSQTWDSDYMYICFNDECPYYVRGWDQMENQGNRGMSYRLMYNPDKDRCMPVPVPSPKALKDGICS